MTSNGTAGQDREDGQEAAKRKLAAAAVGRGAISAKTPRGLRTFPPDQRASDSHDDTRLGNIEEGDAFASPRIETPDETGQRPGRTGAAAARRRTACV